MAPRPHYVTRAFGVREAPCGAKKCHFQCFQKYVRNFTKLSKTLHLLGKANTQQTQLGQHDCVSQPLNLIMSGMSVVTLAF